MKKEVLKINQRIKQNLWCDFTIKSFDGNTLIVQGGVDVYSKVEFEIIFKQVFYLGVLSDWKTNTDRKIVFSLLEGDSMIELNKKYCVTHGNHIFQFFAEDITTHLIVISEYVEMIEK